MKTRHWLGALVALAMGAGAVSAQDYAPGELPEARIWLDRGDQPLLQRGDRVRVYYRTAADAYVAIFHVDTEGTVHLLYPLAPEDDHFTQAGRDYRLLFPQSSYWFVDEYPGKGYFFVVASPEPFDFAAFGYVPFERAWDLTAVGRTVYEDPYLAMDDYVARLIPDWETAPYGLDFMAYDVGEVHDYPRFLCYDCHGYRSYAAWNPYTYACTSFRVVIWDDPYFYPAYRYQGTRVVFAQPRPGVPQYEFKERATGEAWSPVTRTRQTSIPRPVQYAEPSAAVSPAPQWVPPRRTQTAPASVGKSSEPVSRASPSQPGQGTRAIPTSPGNRTPNSTVVPGNRTPSSTAVPGRTQPAPVRAAPAGPKAGSADRPVLERRPSSPTQARPSGGAPVRGSTTGRPTGSIRPSTGSGARGVLPSRPSGGSRQPAALPKRPAAQKPAARPSGGTSRPAARPAPKKPSGGGRASAPPPKRKPGGGVV